MDEGNLLIDQIQILVIVKLYFKILLNTPLNLPTQLDNKVNETIQKGFNVYNIFFL